MSESPRVNQLVDTLTGALKVDEQNATLPPIEAVYERIFHHFGGVDQFAMEVVETCREAKAGSQIKARLMEAMLDGLKVLKDRGLLGSSMGDAEALNDEDLAEAIRRESERAAKIVLEAQDERA